MDARDLYGLPLERFTHERNALAKRLRAEGKRDEAAEVSRLRKPSRSAWAVNQLARTQAREIAALFAAGERLQKAQAGLLAGDVYPAALRDAVEAERAAVHRLAQTARGLLGSEGREATAATLERVSETLHAGALDEDARAQLRKACLAHDLRHIGLGAMGDPMIPTRRTAAGRRRTASPSVTSDRPARERAAEARTARLKAAQQLETKARGRMDRAARDVEAAEQRRDRAAKSLHDAEAALATAHEVADTAALEHRQAQAALDRL